MFPLKRSGASRSGGEQQGRRRWLLGTAGPSRGPCRAPGGASRTNADTSALCWIQWTRSGCRGHTGSPRRWRGCRRPTANGAASRWPLERRAAAVLFAFRREVRLFDRWCCGERMLSAPSHSSHTSVCLFLCLHVKASERLCVLVCVRLCVCLSVCPLVRLSVRLFHTPWGAEQTRKAVLR